MKRALTIGNFDGVHAGHRQLFARVRDVAREHGWMTAALTFDPHPARLLAPERAPRLLTSVAERVKLMRAAGLDEVHVLPFTSELAAYEPERFVREILVERLNAGTVLVGYNFHFGHRQAGNVQLLSELGQQYGFRTEIVSPIRVRGWETSSSEVRRLLSEGNISRACRLLARPYELAGDVVSGFGIGRQQTVPTLNLATQAEVRPARGVYITHTTADDGRSWPSITNIGTRPTFNGDQETIETYLLASLDGETPRRICVAFLRRVREERKFESPEALKAQILRDVNRAQAYFRRRSKSQLY